MSHHQAHTHARACSLSACVDTISLLVRVLGDLLRVIPLAFFLLVPMMEFALPFAIRLFPNLLPSTFEEKHQIEEKRIKLLKVRARAAPAAP